MLTELPLPNKSTPSSSLHSVSSFISDYGIQVGISFPASDDGLSCEERRKLKKKQARKRRKEKSKEAQRQARRQIAAIVQQFYSGETSFAQREKELQGLIEVAYSSDFHDFLDEMIRSRVTLQQRQIWEYTQEILEERHFEREEISFYRLMVMHIYGRWRGIQTASAQIEPMINIYLRYSYPQRDQELAYRNLAVNTFNYMLDTDETLKNLVRICDRRISFLPSEERSRLDEMVGLMDNYEDQDEQGYGCMVGDELHSTAHSEQEEREGQQRRRRKKKVKESDLSCEIQAVMKRLSSLVIKEERGECRVSEQDLTRWKKRRQDYLKS